jgi:ubiquinone biosynthesis protein
MMIVTSLRGAGRLFFIARVLLRYRLDEFLDAIRLFRWVKPLRSLIARPPADIARMSLGARLRSALQELGPIFVKFGQILSTRRDLMPPDIADELALLQDRVAPFDGREAVAAVEAALGAPIAERYTSFDVTPLASASVAQVHAAVMADGSEVVVKVLRPGIRTRIEGDIALLRILGGLADRYAPNAGRIRPLAVVAEIERTLRDELDLQREGSNASMFRRLWEGTDDIYVPQVYWSHSNEDVLTLERVRGIPSADLAALEAAGIDKAALAAKGVRLFYQQVFRDNFFHADAHPGNIWVDADPARAANPRFIALDFGIMGSLPAVDQWYLAANFDAMFRRDYRRIAELHIESGWMPATVRVDDLEAAVRAVCEPYFTRPLSEISLGEVVVKLFQVAHRYQLEIQPQLLLLQKTLLNIEGLGRLLDPRIDIWNVAKPVLDDILREKYSLRALGEDFRKHLPELVRGAPELPRLVHAWLKQSVAGNAALVMRSDDLRALAEISRRTQRATVQAVLGAGLLIAASLLWALDAPGPHLFRVPVVAWIAAALAAGSFVLALRR